MNIVMDEAVEHGVAATCLAFGVHRSTYYRHRAPVLGPAERRPAPPRTLGKEERAVVLETLHEPRFIDLAPAEVHATLLVHRLEQPWPNMPMHFDARRDELIRTILKSSRLPAFLFHFPSSMRARPELQQFGICTHPAPKSDRPC